MAKKILDTTAIFFCDKGIGVTFNVFPGQMIAHGNSKQYLNVNTKGGLTCPGQCTCQPNPIGAGYLPCNQVQIPISLWQGMDHIIKINGAKALTTDASTMCPLGGKIALQGSCNTLFNVGCSFVLTKILVDKTKKEYTPSAEHGNMRQIDSVVRHRGDRKRKGDK